MALAERQNEHADTYVSKEALTPYRKRQKPEDQRLLAVTAPPPAGAQSELLRISRGTVDIFVVPEPETE